MSSLVLSTKGDGSTSELFVPFVSFILMFLKLHYLSSYVTRYFHTYFTLIVTERPQVFYSLTTNSSLKLYMYNKTIETSDFTNV